jgi:hypothetical protein
MEEATQGGNLASRRWGQFPKRMLTEAATTSGVIGVAGLAVGAAALVVAAPVAATLGGALVVVGAGWTAYRAIPPKRHTPAELMGKILNVNELDNIDPPLVRVGFIGASRAGKSTLLDHLQTIRSRDEQTENPYASVVALQRTSPQKYFALVDAAGQYYTQQFKVVDNADVLLVFVDHNEGSSDPTIDQGRLRTHEGFLFQLDSHLKSLNREVRGPLPVPLQTT